MIGMSSLDTPSRQRSRKNLRTALLLGSIAVISLIAFILKVWRLG